MKTQTIIALKLLLVMTLLTGVLYPLVITGVAQLAFHDKANGSMIRENGMIIGSELIGQKFDSTAYFWSRPSSVDNNPLPSGGSNYGPTSDKLKKQVTERKAKFIAANMVKDSSAVPLEMVFASGSGLDPHISPKAALMQVERVAKARGLNTRQRQQLISLITAKTEGPQFGLFGVERINVFMLNLTLDKLVVRH
jgi:potassium-transporting ATPase KdpC subunit